MQEKIKLENYTKKYQNIKPSLIARILIETPKEIKSRFKLDSEKIKKDDYDQVLNALNRNKISKEAVIELLAESAKGKKINFNNYKAVSVNELESFIKDLVEKNKGVSLGGLMGDIKNKYGGAVSGKQAMEILKKHYKES